MDPNHNRALLLQLLIISLVIFFIPAQSTCAPRNTTPVSPSASPHPSYNLRHVSSPMQSPLAYPQHEEKEEFKVVAPTYAYVPPTESTVTNTELKDGISGKKSADIFKPHSVLFPTLSKVWKTDPVIEKMCEKTDYPALCLSSVSPFFNGRTDAASVLGMSIKACSQYAKVAIVAAKKLVNAPSTPAQMASILHDCTDLFSDALDNLQSAMEAMVSRDIGTISIMLSAAVSDFATCEDGFDGESSPMVDFDNKLSNMASNCLAVASLI